MRGYHDLDRLVLDVPDTRADVVAQSMGGVVAVRIAARHPGLVRRLVLVATSGGLDHPDLGAWRRDYRREFPRAVAWVTEDVADQRTLFAAIRAPTLLIWGAADPVSPPAVGEQLGQLIPRSRLVVIPEGSHSLAADSPDAVARLIGTHLSQTT